MHHPRTLQRPYQRVPRPRPPVAEPPGLDWGASGWAGLGAGAAFILIQTFIGLVFGSGGATEAVRRLASIALGEFVLSDGTPFTALVFFAAAAVHIPLSLLYARLLAAMIHGLEMPRALEVGAVFGTALYFVNYHLISGIFPWFVSARGPGALIAHLAFGLLTAWIYTSLTARSRSRQAP
ncbi:MAG: sodium:proline symporter [Elusimicrobia bacterium]|nr:sodium:proline symporter [Elusimicrobiota bacterium]